MTSYWEVLFVDRFGVFEESDETIRKNKKKQEKTCKIIFVKFWVVRDGYPLFLFL